MSTNIFDQRKCTYGEISHNTANSECFEKCEQAKKVEIHLKLLRNIWSEIAWILPETVAVWTLAQRGQKGLRNLQCGQLRDYFAKTLLLAPMKYRSLKITIERNFSTISTFQPEISDHDKDRTWDSTSHEKLNGENTINFSQKSFSNFSRCRDNIIPVIEIILEIVFFWPWIRSVIRNQLFRFHSEKFQWFLFSINSTT